MFLLDFSLLWFFGAHENKNESRAHHHVEQDTLVVGLYGHELHKQTKKTNKYGMVGVNVFGSRTCGFAWLPALLLWMAMPLLNDRQGPWCCVPGTEVHKRWPGGKAPEPQLYTHSTLPSI